MRKIVTYYFQPSSSWLAIQDSTLPQLSKVYSNILAGFLAPQGLSLPPSSPAFESIWRFITPSSPIAHVCSLLGSCSDCVLTQLTGNDPLALLPTPWPLPLLQSTPTPQRTSHPLPSPTPAPPGVQPTPWVYWSVEWSGGEEGRERKISKKELG